MRKASGHPLPIVIKERRLGDLPVYYADTTKAKEELKWEAKRNVDQMCQGKFFFNFIFLCSLSFHLFLFL